MCVSTVCVSKLEEYSQTFFCSSFTDTFVLSLIKIIKLVSLSVKSKFLPLKVIFLEFKSKLYFPILMLD